MEKIVSATVRKFTPFSQINEKIGVLYLAASPSRLGQINTGRDSRFKDLIKYFDEEKRFQFTEQQGITREQFQYFILQSRPHILHYSGHGNTEGIFLEDGQVNASVLRDILKLVPNTQCVLLSACKSVAAAREVARIVPYAIGTSRNVDDNAAIEFARGFYQALVSGYTVEDAFEAGKVAVALKSLPDDDVWVLVKGIRDPESPQEVPVSVPVSTQKAPKRAFISSVSADKTALEKFKAQLSTYRRNNSLTHWDEGELIPGTDRIPAIKKEFDAADILFFLVSADFLADDEKWEKVIPEALARHRDGTVVVAPILVRPCGWKNTALGALSPLPANEVAISSWEKPDEAWNEVITSIGRLLGDLQC